MQKIVLIGGGSGLAPIVQILSQKQKNLQLTVLVPISDSGGSSGKLRQTLQIPALGDLRQNFSASLNPALANLLEKRNFDHPLGNLILAFWTKKFGLPKTLKNYTKLLQTKTQILSSASSASTLIGEFANGQTLTEEKKFENPSPQLRTQDLCKIYLKPQPKLNPQAKTALQNASKIIVGPGSFFASLVAHFLVAGFPQTFQQAKAKKIFIQNCVSQFSAEQNFAKFLPVTFTEIWSPPPKQKKWPAKLLTSKILQS